MPGRKDLLELCFRVRFSVFTAFELHAFLGIQDFLEEET